MRKTNECLLEAIVSSFGDARAAASAGADRFELCSALALGGLTPSLGTVKALKKKLDVPAMCMVRPREGGMAYSDDEFEAMLLDAALMLEAGADGLVFGFLTSEGEVDLPRCRALLDLARQARKGEAQSVFHRAFDVVADPDLALEQLVDLGVTRILTSGRAPTAIEGIDEISRYVDLAKGRIEILPGGGIDANTVGRLVSQTGARQVHMYVTRIEEDRSVLANPTIYFGAHVPESELDVRVVDEEELRRIRDLLDEL